MVRLDWMTEVDWDNLQSEDSVTHPSSKVIFRPMAYDGFEDGEVDGYSFGGSSGSFDVIQEESPEGGSWSGMIEQHAGSGTDYQAISESDFDWTGNYEFQFLVKSEQYNSNPYLSTSIGWRSGTQGSDTIMVRPFSTDSNGTEAPFEFLGGGVSNSTTVSVNWQQGEWLWIKGECDDSTSTAQAKMWWNGEEEPSSYQISADITTGISSGPYWFRANGSSNDSIDLRIDYLSWSGDSGNIVCMPKSS